MRMFSTIQQFQIKLGILYSIVVYWKSFSDIKIDISVFRL